jgi:hypothetical protein
MKIADRNRLDKRREPSVAKYNFPAILLGGYFFSGFDSDDLLSVFVSDFVSEEDEDDAEASVLLLPSLPLDFFA